MGFWIANFGIKQKGQRFLNSEFGPPWCDLDGLEYFRLIDPIDGVLSMISDQSIWAGEWGMRKERFPQIIGGLRAKSTQKTNPER